MYAVVMQHSRMMAHGGEGGGSAEMDVAVCLWMMEALAKSNPVR